MTKEKAQEILHDLNNEARYIVTMDFYYNEYVINVEENVQFESTMYLTPTLIEVMARHSKGCSISTIVGRGMRVIII